jgi:RNA polymerase sigma-70 factor (ECF subfamily)
LGFACRRPPLETSTSLLERLRDCPGDEQSWQRLDELYRPLILSWLRRDPALGADAEDLAQEIMSVVCRELPSFTRQRTGSFRKWLRTVTAYRVRGHHRARQSRPQALGAEADEGPLVELADDRSEQARRWDVEHNEYVVRRLLELMATEFSDRDVRAFRRVVLDEVRPAQVAEELGVSVNVVLLAKSRILQHLRAVGKGLLE